jgi:NDP-sugar pyrophosphorylase family protein
MDRRLQLVLPMAGEGQRFRRAGISTPKPLIDVGGVPMYQLVLSNLWDELLHSVVLISRHDFGLGKHTDYLSDCLQVPIHVISVRETTGGPADSVDLARSHLREELPVVIANSDQWVDFPIHDFYSQLLDLPVSGNILAMHDDDPKWSYVELNDNGEVIRVVEKEVVSQLATVGVYGFKSELDRRGAFDKMRHQKAQVNGEYYVAPSYNYLDRALGPVVTCDLGPVGTSMFGLGTPQDFGRFMQSSLVTTAVGKANEIFS